MSPVRSEGAELLNAAPDSILIVDRRGNVAFANSRIEALFGYASSELIGCAVGMLIPDRLRASHEGHLRGYFARPTVRPMGVGLELSGRRKDGSEFPVEISLGPWQLADEQCAWAIIRDSTVHRDLELERRFADQLLSTVPTIVLLLDSEGRIARINAYMERLCGYPSHEVVGRDWFTMFIPEEDRAAVRGLFDTAMRTGANGDPGNTNPIVTRDGTVRQIEWHGQTLEHEDGRHALLCVGYDVTERLLHERALQRAEKALREADDHRNRFLAMLGHELRNPLAAISTALELTRMASDPEPLLRYRDMMERQVEQLTRLVDDLLEVSRISRGALRLQRKRLSLSDLVRSAAEDVQWLVDEAGHSLALEIPSDPITVHADPVRMTQVLTNLMTNAAKYTPAGGRIEVAVERTSEGVRISVKDNGIGIPPDKLEVVFEMFEQLSSPAHEGHEGHGIGLNLARALTEMHGGTLVVRSAGAQRGSEFIVWLPSSGPAASSDAPGASDVHSPEPGEVGGVPSVSGTRVLVIDSDHGAAHALAALLRELGHEAAVALEGLEAVEKAEGFRPQLVMLDSGLRQPKSHHVTRWIRGRQWAEGVRVVGMMGAAGKSDGILTEDAGFDRQVTKPVTRRTLLELLTPATERA